jgi:hypothetical protein
LDYIDSLIEHLRRTSCDGWTVIYNNAPIHGTEAANRLVNASLRVKKLPAWSPFLNSIEESFFKLKLGVCKHKLDSRDSLLMRIRQSSNLITPEDCQG